MQPKKESFFRRYFSLYAVLIVGIVAFGTGFFVGAEEVNKLSPEEAFPKLVDSVQGHAENGLDPLIFDMVWERVDEKYVDQPVEREDLFYGAISGVVDGLNDPYSTFFPPEATKKFKEELSGEFEGIGAEIGIKENGLRVVAPLNGSPAELAGLRPGDLILQIDGSDSGSLSLDEAVNLIRGPEGTEVTLTIYRLEDDEPLQIKITREKIELKSVLVDVKEADGKKIGIITITSFAEDTTANFYNRVSELLLQEVDAVVLDLRNNPGGFLNSAVKISSAWVSSGSIVYEQYSDGSRIPHDATGDSPFESMPTVVLINEGSASASEIVAGALKDFEKATLIGATSFGKGSVQDFEEFRDGSSLKLTVARWLTPNGELIDGYGVTPNQEVEFTFEDYEAKRDPQLDAAINHLTK